MHFTVYGCHIWVSYMLLMLTMIVSMIKLQTSTHVSMRDNSDKHKRRFLKVLVLLAKQNIIHLHNYGIFVLLYVCIAVCLYCVCLYYGMFVLRCICITLYLYYGMFVLLYICIAVCLYYGMFVLRCICITLYFYYGIFGVCKGDI